jgi:sec-independent protein translocase protein TatA
MGLGGISIWQLVIILVIVLLIFGTKRLKGLGGDLGGAIKGFKEAVSNDGEESDEEKAAEQNAGGDTSNNANDGAAQTKQSAEPDGEKNGSDKTV